MALSNLNFMLFGYKLLENIKNSNEIITPEEECIFDLKTQTDEFLKKIPEFSNYVWNKKDKKATIKLNNGRKLIVTRGGCDHFSFYGNLILDKTQLDLKNEDEIFKLSLWVAEKLFHKSDYELMKEQLLKTKNYKLEKTIDQYYLTFTQDNYCNMTLVAENLNDENLISVEIGYYIC